MNEDDAQDWVRLSFGSEVFTSLEQYRQSLVDESTRQNLVAASTLSHIWSRHFADSLQLVALSVAAGPGAWIDIGSGAGLPGIPVALAIERQIVLVEPRRLRVEFLHRCINALGLGRRVTINASKIERVNLPTAAVLSARAVASLDSLMAGAVHLADSSTVWLLPKGSSAQSEVATAKRSWQGVFHVEHSIVDPTSGIVVARGVKKR